MDLFHRNGNQKRKFSQSIERDENEQQSIGCFRRCCMRKKQQITINQKENRKQISNEKTLDAPIIQFTRSPLFNETNFCQKGAPLDDDPCLECCVQYGPDAWENISKHERKRLPDNHEFVSNKRINCDAFDRVSAKEKSIAEADNTLKTNVNSSDKNIVGDGIEQLSDVVETKSITRYQSSTNPNDHFQQNELKEHSPDFNQSEPTVEKQTSTDHSSDNVSPQIMADDYNWNLPSNETNIDQQKLSHQTNSSQDQEPYNWDDQEYQWSTSVDSPEQTPLINSLQKHIHSSPESIHNRSKQSGINDIDSATSKDDLSYSTASVSLSNKEKKVRSPSSNNVSGRLQNSSTLRSSESAERISGREMIGERSEQKSVDSNSSSTNLPISASIGPSESPKTETEQLTNVRNADTPNQINPITRDLPKRPDQSPLVDTRENHPSNAEFTNPFHQIRSTYDDIINSWRHFFERFSNFILSPPAHITDDNLDLSSTSITHSWSTMTPTETLNTTHCNNIGPWWSRRDVYDQTPALFILANESLSASYSIEPIFNRKQTCMSIEQKPCCFNDHRQSNTSLCCCNSSRTINSSSSFPINRLFS